MEVTGMCFQGGGVRFCNCAHMFAYFMLGCLCLHDSLHEVNTLRVSVPCIPHGMSWTPNYVKIELCSFFRSIKMRNVLISSTDFELFDSDMTAQDYEFFQKHKGAFKSLLEDQVWSDKWINGLLHFKCLYSPLGWEGFFKMFSHAPGLGGYDIK